MSEKILTNDTPFNAKEEGSIQKKIYVTKLVLLGDVFVGKTSISLRYLFIWRREKKISMKNIKIFLRFVKDEFSDLQESTVGKFFVYLCKIMNKNELNIRGCFSSALDWIKRCHCEIWYLGYGRPREIPFTCADVL